MTIGTGNLAKVFILSLCLLKFFSFQETKPYENEIRAFRKMDAEHPPAKGQILFIGSSSFVRWSTLSRDFPSYQILNRAFGGSTLLDVIARVDDVVFPYDPRQVVVYCGENDFATDPNLGVDTLVSRFKTLYLCIRKRLSHVNFVYVSMKPSPSRWSLAPKFQEANQKIESILSHDPQSAFVDLWPVMLNPNGKPKAEIYVEDQLHVNESGYRLWIPLLEKVLLKNQSRWSKLDQRLHSTEIGD